MHFGLICVNWLDHTSDWYVKGECVNNWVFGGVVIMNWWFTLWHLCNFLKLFSQRLNRIKSPMATEFSWVEPPFSMSDYSKCPICPRTQAPNSSFIRFESFNSSIPIFNSDTDSTSGTTLEGTMGGTIWGTIIFFETFWMFIIWKSLIFEISWHSKSGTWPWILKFQKLIYTVLKLNFYTPSLGDTTWRQFPDVGDSIQILKMLMVDAGIKRLVAKFITNILKLSQTSVTNLDRAT